MEVIPLMKNAFLAERHTREELANFVLYTERFSMGEMCAKFEEEFCKYQKCDYAILFNSGGSANLALLQALKNLGSIKEGDRIGFSALTWSTNVMPIIQLGFVPVPVDCCVETLNVMAENLEERLKELHLSVFFATNVLGFTGDLASIKKICDREGIIFLEDNCESLGAKISGKNAGNFGLASTFSFFVAHHMSTIEGGMVCTNNQKLAEMLMITRANGWDRNLPVDAQRKLRQPLSISDFQSKYSFFDLGFNLRPTEITGFLGSTQLKYLEENIEYRIENHKMFESIMVENPNLIPTSYNHMDRISPFALTIVCKDSGIREKYLKRFFQAGIECRPVIAGNMQRQPFYHKYVDKTYKLENADFIHSCGFYCGNYPELSQDDIYAICMCLTR